MRTGAGWRARPGGPPDWVPLHEVERVCQIVVGCVCRALWDTIELGHCDGMLGLSRWAADRLPEALGFLRAAYVEEMRRLGEQAAGRQRHHRHAPRRR